MLFHLPPGFKAIKVVAPKTSYPPSLYLLASLLTLLAIAATPKGAWLTLGFYGGGILIFLILNRLNGRSLWQKVSVEFLFINLILLSSLFQTGGDILWRSGWLKITSNGLITLGTVSSKVFLSLLVINILSQLLTQKQIFTALLALKIPPLLVVVMESMLRYLQLLMREFQGMHRAAQGRNFLLTPQSTRLIISQMIGSLFIRTYDRGERIHQAMVARGYDGLPPSHSHEQLFLSPQAWRFLAMVLAWLLFGQALHYFGVKFPTP